MRGDSLEEKKRRTQGGLYSTETWLCACIIENERLRRCRLPQKRGLSQFIESVEVVSFSPDVPSREVCTRFYLIAQPQTFT